MILKGGQRANGGDLAIHLMNSFDNERVEIVELRGAVADDLYGAFAEFEAVAAGTRAQKYLYSLSINPPEPLTQDQYLEAIATIEDRLGLTGQPRAVVFHAKPDETGIAREHCHVVWSRIEIEIEKMKAIHLSHDKSKLMDCAVELSHRFGFELPPGLKAWEDKHGFKKDKLEPTLAEIAQQDDTGITPEERRAEITQAYEQADSAEAFRAALDDRDYVLAKRDRRGLVIVDRQCAVHSLTRYIKGHKARDIKAKLAGLEPDDLPSVDQAKTLIKDRARQKQSEGKAQVEGNNGEGNSGEGTGVDLAAMRKSLERGLAEKNARRGARLQAKEQQMLTRQQSERLALHRAQLRESKRLGFRARRAVADLIGKTPGLRSVLGPLQRRTHLDPAERHKKEDEALKRRHDLEKKDAARHKRVAERLQTRERQALERRMKRAALKAQSPEQPLRLEFAAAAQGVRARQDSDLPKGKVSEQFNDAGEFSEGRAEALAAEAEDAADDQQQARSWKQRTEELDEADERRRSRKNKRGRGAGYKRDDD